jgi:hypothetical protein
MRKIFLIIAISFIFFLPSRVKAQIVADQSASIVNIAKEEFNEIERLYLIKKTIQFIFDKYNSPLSSNISSFVKTCLKYNLDCYLLPAIAGLESSFGKYILPNSYNPFGWGGGYIMFNSWDEAIETVGQKLRNNYIDKGFNDIYLIGKIYSESPTWASRILSIMDYFKKIENEQSLLLKSNQVKL